GYPDQVRDLWRDHGLVFASVVGTPLDPSHVRRTLPEYLHSRRDWRELEPTRATAHICLDHERVGCPVEEIARLVGHSTTSTTETVYRRESRLVISTGAEVMDDLFRVG